MKASIQLAHINDTLDSITNNQISDTSQTSVPPIKNSNLTSSVEHLTQYKAAYYQANKQKIADRARRYRAVNKEAISQSKKSYDEKNKQKIAGRGKKYRQDNRAAINLRKKIWAKQKYEPTKWKHAHARKYKKVLEELMLRFTYKICLECKISKDLRSFRHAQTKKEVSRCNSCRQKKNQSQKSVDYNEKARAYYRDVLVPYSDSIKRAGFCVDCGEQNWLVLEFDHRNPADKKNLVLRSKTLDKMKAEIAKCDLRCAVCHTLKTLAAKGKSSCTGKRKKKVDFVNNFKLSLRNCASCPRKITPGNIAAFELDHLNRETKIDNISHMCIHSEYNLKQLQAELEKVRVLCRNCHRLHALQQLYDKCG